MSPANGRALRGVLGVVDGPSAERLLAGEPLPEGLGGVELRADLLASAERALGVLDRLAAEVPVLFTLRRRDQGGRFSGREADRLALYRRALERGAAAVDAEYGTDTARELAAAGWPFVASWHDFRGMPDPASLAELTRTLEGLGPRAVKVVPTAAALHDAARMLAWVEGARPGRPSRVGFAMGERGLPSRVLSLARGAPWTYGALGDVVAPGQPGVADLVRLYRAERHGPSTGLLAVVGNPVAHSLSPHMHNPALERARVDTVYLPLALDALDELEPCWEPLGIRGLSVTIPFKEDACRRADETDERTRASGAANTLVPLGPDRSGRMRLRAYNTDFEGVLEPLRRRAGRLEGLRVAVLGNGGAARGAARALVEAGARPHLYYRNVERGSPVARELGVPGALLAELRGDDADVVLNATPVGLHPGDPSPVADTAIPEGGIAFDMVYDPPETAFLAAARRRGCRTIPGGEMLIAQGLEQFRLFTGCEPDREAFEEGFAAGLRARAARRGN